MKIAVLTGAGISAESGLSTFRDQGGLWEQHRIEDVATPGAFERNPSLVHRFYNLRRTQLAQVQPNVAHIALAQLESVAAVFIITQNVDDLHERAGSTRVLHLHGQLTRARSTRNPQLTWEVGYGELDEHTPGPDGAPARPDIVWFGEDVPLMDQAEALVQEADHLVVIGTSLQVYPAAGLVYAAQPGTPITLIDPAAQMPPQMRHPVEIIRQKATTGVVEWMQRLMP
jgi:NAD-dependent deacetylase